MVTTTIHREDVKAALRKRHGTLEAFQEAAGLTGQQIRDLLRGKSKVALAAVAKELGLDPNHLIITGGAIPVCGTHSNETASAHRLNAGSK